MATLAVRLPDPPDGRTLAVLSSHMPRVRFVDVGWAVTHPSDAPPTRRVSLAAEGQFMLGRDVVFRSADRVELEVCRYQIVEGQQTGALACVDAPALRAVSVPESIRQ